MARKTIKLYIKDYMNILNTKSVSALLITILGIIYFKLSIPEPISEWDKSRCFIFFMLGIFTGFITAIRALGRKSEFNDESNLLASSIVMPLVYSLLPLTNILNQKDTLILYACSICAYFIGYYLRKAENYV